MKKIDKTKCRICLIEPGAINLFEKQISLQDECYKVLMDITNIQITKNGTFPESICSGCFKKLKQFHFFKKQIQAIEKYYMEEYESHLKLKQVNADERDSSPLKEPKNREAHLTESKQSEIVETATKSEPESVMKISVLSKNIKKIRSKQHSCEICGKLVLKNNIRRHLATHSKKKEFICHVCHKLYKTQQSLENHVRNIHLRQRKRGFVCKICKIMGVKQQKCVHDINFNIREKTLSCVVCDKQFATKQAMKNHLIRHENERKHVCEFCKKTFNFPTNLSEHLKLKHPAASFKEKSLPFKCDDCKFQGRYRSILKQHMLAKHCDNVRPYKCDICKKMYRYASSLWKHMILHRKNRPYVCEICSKGFNQQPHLRKHVRTIHNQNI